MLDGFKDNTNIQREGANPSEPSLPGALLLWSPVASFPFYHKSLTHSSGSQPPLSEEGFLPLHKENRARYWWRAQTRLSIWNVPVITPFLPSETHHFQEYLLLLCSWFFSFFPSLELVENHFFSCPMHFYSPPPYQLSNWKYTQSPPSSELLAAPRPPYCSLSLLPPDFWGRGEKSPWCSLLASQLRSHVDPLNCGSHHIPFYWQCENMEAQTKSEKALGFSQGL